MGKQLRNFYEDTLFKRCGVPRFSLVSRVVRRPMTEERDSPLCLSVCVFFSPVFTNFSLILVLPRFRRRDHHSRHAEAPYKRIYKHTERMSAKYVVARSRGKRGDKKKKKHSSNEKVFRSEFSSNVSDAPLASRARTSMGHRSQCDAMHRNTTMSPDRYCHQRFLPTFFFLLVPLDVFTLRIRMYI